MRASRGVRSSLAAIALLGTGVGAGLAGCASSDSVGDEPAAVEAPARDLPTYARVAGAQNARVANLGRVWAAAAALVTYEDQDGRVRTEQAEGYLQIIQPTQVALSLGKQITSDVYFYLGSNQTQYWWFDRLDAERKVAFVGTHAMATPERAAGFGAPVHPLDLLDLLGITPLPEPRVPSAAALAEQAAAERAESVEGDESPLSRRARDLTLPEGVSVGWTPDGEQVLVQVPGRFGTRRVWFEPGTLMPRRVEILDARGRVAVRSTIGRDVLVPVRGDSRLRPMMGESVAVEIPGTPISVRLLLSRLENRGERQSSAPFNLERLLEAYPVGRVEDIDLWEFREAGAPEDGATPENAGGGRVPDRRLRAAPSRGG